MGLDVKVQEEGVHGGSRIKEARDEDNGGTKEADGSSVASLLMVHIIDRYGISWLHAPGKEHCMRSEPDIGSREGNKLYAL